MTETPAEKLLTITRDNSPQMIASLIATKMIFYATSEWYRYRIKHDLGPPDYHACPVSYDWASKGYVGIDSTNKAHARKWLTDAMLAGYWITEIDIKRKPVGRTESIELALKRAEFHQRTKDDDDDDIPF